MPENTKERDTIEALHGIREAASREQCIPFQQWAKGTLILRNKHGIHVHHKNVGLGSFKDILLILLCQSTRGISVEKLLVNHWVQKLKHICDGLLKENPHQVKRIVVRKMQQEVINRAEKDPKSWTHF